MRCRIDIVKRGIVHDQVMVGSHAGARNYIMSKVVAYNGIIGGSPILMIINLNPRARPISVIAIKNAKYAKGRRSPAEGPRTLGLRGFRFNEGVNRQIRMEYSRAL